MWMVRVLQGLYRAIARCRRDLELVGQVVGTQRVVADDPKRSWQVGKEGGVVQW